MHSGKRIDDQRRLPVMAAAMLSLAALVLPPNPAIAQTSQVEDSAAPAAGQLAPFPEVDTFRLQVYGDDFAAGLHEALTDSVANDQRIQVQRRLKPIGALIRPDWEEDLRAEEVSREPVHIAVLMFGLSDRQVIRPQPGQRPYAIGSPDWRAEYGRRVERWLKALRSRNIVVYLVGMPVMRRSDIQQQTEMINDILREKAYINGVRFIDIMETFQDDNGGFSQFGPDLSGNRQKLRDGDGVTFTTIGNRKLAHFVEREVKRDVTQALADRAVPLAGSEAEQRRINPAKVVAAQPVAGGWKSAVTIAAPRSRGQQAAAERPASAQVPPESSLDQKAENARVAVKTINAAGREETLTLDIVRPAIPAAVISLLTRKEAGDRATQPGEPLVEMLPNGATVISSVSSLTEGSAAAQRQRRNSGPQSPYYIVMIKGERLASKPGRADDFSWPRPDPEAALPATPSATARPAPAPAARVPSGGNIPRATLPPPGQTAAGKAAQPAPQQQPQPKQQPQR